VKYTGTNVGARHGASLAVSSAFSLLAAFIYLDHKLFRSPIGGIVSFCPKPNLISYVETMYFRN
jgi:hypothetical protein